MRAEALCRFQLRCVMTQPLTVFPGAEVFGTLKLVAHPRQSYDIYATVGVKSMKPHAADQKVIPLKHTVYTSCLLCKVQKCAWTTMLIAPWHVDVGHSESFTGERQIAWCRSLGSLT